MKTEYKTSRKYKCPYCELKATRSELIDHVDRKHTDVLPEDYTAARAVFDSINGKNYGTCMVCKEKVYKWNDKCNRYYNLCDKPECRAKVREMALKNHIKVYDKPTLLDDPEHQQKMLANRKISGTYVFTDGGKVTYTGSYEKKALEFMDKVLNIPSRDIQAPGPTFEYTYNGETHVWITDFYYIPANLVIEVKDGGSNPNNRSMPDYRNKQVAKEEMITNLGKFNYIRLTNNDFAQLLAVLADMKAEVMENENPKIITRINEEVGGLPPHKPPEAYIIPYGMNNVFSGFAYGDSTESSEVVVPMDGTAYKMSKKEFHDKYQADMALYYNGKDKEEKIKQIREMIDFGFDTIRPCTFAEALAGIDMITPQDILHTDCFYCNNMDREEAINNMITTGIKNAITNENLSDTPVMEYCGVISIYKTMDGFYGKVNEGLLPFSMSTDTYPTIDKLIVSGNLELMEKYIHCFHNKK